MSAPPEKSLPEARSSAWVAYLLCAVAAACWGGNAVSSRIAVGDISPMLLTTLRWLVVLVLLSVVAPRTIYGSWRQILPHWRYGLLMGAFGYTIFSAALYVAGHFTSAVNLALLQGAIPIFVLVGAYIMYGARIDRIAMVGVALTLIGVVIVATKGDIDVLLSMRFNVGDVMIVAASLFYGVYTLYLRRRPDLPANVVFAMMAIGAFVSGIPLMIGEIALGYAQWPTWVGWAVVLFVGLGPSYLAQRSFMRGVEMIGPGRAGLFVNLVPVFGAFFSVLILGETFGLYHAIAMALVLGGIALAERKALFK